MPTIHMKIANLTLKGQTTQVGEFSHLALVGLQPWMKALNSLARITGTTLSVTSAT